MILSLTLANKFLFSRQTKSLRSVVVLISILGIFFASAAVLVTLGVLAGYQRVYTDAVFNFGGHLVVFDDAGFSDSQQNELSEYLKHYPAQNIFTPYHFAEVLAPGKNGFKPMLFKGIDAEKIKKMYPVVYEDLPVGTQNNVFAGKDVISSQPDINTSGNFRFLIVKDTDGSERTRTKTIPLQGYFDSGYFDFNSKFVLMPLSILQEISGSKLVSGFEIRLVDANQTQRLVQDLKDHYAATDVKILPWWEMNRSLFDALKLERSVVFVITFLVIMIACLNIFGFNFLFFMQRRREFLILSSLGLNLRNQKLLLIWLSLFLGAFAAIAGSVVGLIVLNYLSHVGVALDPTVYFVNHVPVYFKFSWFAFFILGTIILCWLTSLAAGQVLLKRHMGAGLLK